jgi:hypothetical protein
MDGQFFTLDTLATITSLVAAIMLIVQFSKGIIDFVYNKICGLFKYETNGFSTQAWVVIVSEIMFFLVMYFQGNLDSNLSIFLTAINGLVVATACMKSYEAIANEGSEKAIASIKAIEATKIS